VISGVMRKSLYVNVAWLVAAGALMLGCHSGNHFIATHGSFVPFGFTDDRLIIAADSASVPYDGKTATLTTECKITALDDKSIFAATGLETAGHGDKVIELANDVAHEGFKRSHDPKDQATFWGGK